MARTTIDYGIDLGTTNSVVAIMERRGARVLTGPDNQLSTPSAVHVRATGEVIVGAAAKERAVKDEANTRVRWKRIIGLTEGADVAKTFAASGRQMLPHELSAEVLKSLRDTIRDRRGDEPREIVITIPAAFDSLQTDATKTAAHLAGFEECYLLQEPIAAGLAYGLEKMDETAYWLIYDFGGGTFDASVIYLDEGLPTVKGHAGDAFLGGTDIDSDLVSVFLRPALLADHDLEPHDPDSGFWREIDSELIECAEEAKIRVCRSRKEAAIKIEELCKDRNGNRVEFNFVLKPEHVIEVTKPYIAQTVTFSKACLAEAKIGPEDLDKVVMVGGSTMNPWVREAIEKEFGRPLEISIDPMTVVAEGAAMFAGTVNRKLRDDDVPQGSFGLEVTSQLTIDESPADFSARIVRTDGAEIPDGLTIELIDDGAEWTTGRIQVRDNGVVRTRLRVAEDEGATFRVQLSNAQGVALDCVPETFEIRWGAGASVDMPLSDHIGVGLNSGELMPILRKGSALPARGRNDVRTVHEVRKGDGDSRLLIPLFEGSNLLRAERNAHLITIEIRGEDVPEDIPAGTQAEVMLYCDKMARQLFVEVLFPTIDEHFVNTTVAMDKRVPDLEHIRRMLIREERRQERLAEEVAEVDDQALRSLLAEVEAQDYAMQVRRQITERRDADALKNAETQVRRFASELDRVEDALQMPKVIAELDTWMESAEGLVQRSEDAAEYQVLLNLRSEVDAARHSRSILELRQRLAGVQRFVSRLREGDVQWWVDVHGYLNDNLGRMREHNIALMLFKQAETARDNNDFDSFKAAVRQLIGQLPDAGGSLDLSSDPDGSGVSGL